MKIKLEATIPTTQYGNLRPTIEMDSMDEETEALEAIKRLWNRFGETPLQDKTGQGSRFETFTWETVIYDDSTHSYYDTEGNPLVSASQYAQQFAKAFDKDRIIGPFAEKNGWTVDKVDEMWRLGNTISTSYGTAMHECVEMLVAHGDTDYVDKYVPVVLREPVAEVCKLIPDNTHAEVLVSDVNNGRAGRIDFLVVDGKKFSIIDLKTNREMKPDKIKVYSKQLSFYADILIQHGYELDTLKLVHYDGNEVKEIPLDYEPTL